MPPREGTSPVVVPARDAWFTWLGAWAVGQVLAVLVAGASGASTIAEAGAGWLVVTAVVGWVPLLVGVHLVTLRHATGHAAVQAVSQAAGRPSTAAQRIGLSFRMSDLVGVPLGVAVQVVALPALYWPLRQVFPDAFSLDDVERRARELYDGTSAGSGIILLVLVVVVGAPLVEEIVYRGLLQGSSVARWGRTWGLWSVAVWFALVHFQPVEIPGLLAVALVFGWLRDRTGRLGASILTHMAFNAAGLWLVAGS